MSATVKTSLCHPMTQGLSHMVAPAGPQDSARWRVVLVTLHRILGVADAMADIALNLVANAADLLSAVPGQATQRFLDPSPDLRHRALGLLLVHLLLACARLRRFVSGRAGVSHAGS